MKGNNRVLYLSHGGGPLPLLGDEGHVEMVENLELLAKKLKKPSAIIVVSAHWEESQPNIISGSGPKIIYDYSGFPPESYDISYPASGSPELAVKLDKILREKGVESVLNGDRGFDHGLYVPLKIMYPDADIPCIQLSLLRSLSPDEHIRLGEAFSEIDEENLLLVGSGFSFHNMRAFFLKDTPETIERNCQFEEWLIETCSNRELSEDERRERLVNWADAPHARYCHPREEHLLPLHVCYGFAGRACTEYYELKILNKKASVYLW